jgi:uncharacterized UBP type Zn finger protein
MGSHILKKRITLSVSNSARLHRRVPLVRFCTTPAPRNLTLTAIEDCYCYICNDSKTDPAIGEHLATFGINVQAQTKTEKSMTELVRLTPSIIMFSADKGPFLSQQIEHNLKFDFSLTSEDGKPLEPMFGPGLTGLSNLGNR